jgi:hypothetical protein
VYTLARTLQLLGLVVTGIGLWDGLLGGNVRRELVLLGIGAALFFGGRWLQGTSR